MARTTTCSVLLLAGLLLISTLPALAEDETWPPAWFPHGLPPSPPDWGKGCDELEQEMGLPAGAITLCDATWRLSYNIQTITYREPCTGCGPNATCNVYIGLEASQSNDFGVNGGVAVIVNPEYSSIYSCETGDSIGAWISYAGANNAYAGYIAFRMITPQGKRWVRAVSTGNYPSQKAWPYGYDGPGSHPDWTTWREQHLITENGGSTYTGPDQTWFQDAKDDMDAKWDALLQWLQDTYDDFKQWFTDLFTPDATHKQQALTDATAWSNWGPWGFIRNFTTYFQLQFAAGAAAGEVGDDPNNQMIWNGATIFTPPGIRNPQGETSDGTQRWGEYTNATNFAQYVPDNWRLFLRTCTGVLFHLCTILFIAKILYPKLVI